MHLYIYIYIIPHDITMFHHVEKHHHVFVELSASRLGILSPVAASHGVAAPAAGLQRRQCHSILRPGALATRPAAV